MFEAKNLKGFGLMQRDRRFEHYQDLELGYEARPSYWSNRATTGAKALSNSSNSPRGRDLRQHHLRFVPKAPVEPAIRSTSLSHLFDERWPRPAQTGRNDCPIRRPRQRWFRPSRWRAIRAA